MVTDVMIVTAEYDSAPVGDATALLPATTTKKQVLSCWPGYTVEGRRKLLETRLLLGHIDPAGCA